MLEKLSRPTLQENEITSLKCELFNLLVFIMFSYSQGRRLREDSGIVPLKYLGGWDGDAFTPPPMFRKCHCKLSQWKRSRRRETEGTTPVTDTQAYFIGLLIYMQAHTMIVS